MAARRSEFELGYASSIFEQAVGRRLDAGGATVEHRGVDHRGGEVLVAE
jgi:hypothetical protein